MTRKTSKASVTAEVRGILAAASFALAGKKSEKPVEPQELDEPADIAADLFCMVANGCGRRDVAQENADFISPVLLAA
jgi:hypothetical protein